MARCRAWAGCCPDTGEGELELQPPPAGQARHRPLTGPLAVATPAGRRAGSESGPAGRCGPRGLRVVGGLGWSGSPRTRRHRSQAQLRLNSDSDPNSESEPRLLVLPSDSDSELPSAAAAAGDRAVFLPGGAIAINLKARPVTGGCHGGWEPCSVPLPWYSRPTEQCAASRSQPCVTSSGIEKLYGYVRL